MQCIKRSHKYLKKKPTNTPTPPYKTIMTSYLIKTVQKPSKFLLSSCSKINTSKLKGTTIMPQSYYFRIGFLRKGYLFWFSLLLYTLSRGTLLLLLQNELFHPYTICTSTHMPISQCPEPLCCHPISPTNPNPIL